MMTRRQVCILIASPLTAAQPPGVTAKLSTAPRYNFPALPEQKPSTTDKAQGEAIGKHRSLPAAALKKGRWVKLSDGRRLWRLAIHSPKAVGIRVHFTRFAAGPGKVWLYGGAESVGPYTAAGIDETGSFWTDTVFSDLVTVEYEGKLASPPFQIVEITHLFR
ncbi:MAG TPA: hypothetical protein VM120_06270 [Bryobacteraceae bacterium]|nr:hypothetical protein [Bryobacteraceae bacterium]